MSDARNYPGIGDFAHGVHPDDAKHFAADKAIEVLKTPSEVIVPLSQHIGAPCEATVKAREDVKLGDVIGKSTGFVSSNVHATVNGKTGRPGVANLPGGKHVNTVPITPSDDQLEGQNLFDYVFGGDWPKGSFEELKPEDISQKVLSAGIVGLGGAAFPTHVKITRNEKKPVDTLLLNGCECEPYLTADYRLMLEAPAPIVTGAQLLGRACGAKDIYITIEDNKPKAIEAMKKAVEGTDIKVAVVHTKYPMGGEKFTIKAVLGREVPIGGLPLDVGVVVSNVGTAVAVAAAVLYDKPLTHRLVTVSGQGINEPKNLLLPIGTPVKELIAACGGLKPEATRLISGGPIMGFAISDVTIPVTKGTSGILALAESDLRMEEQGPCLRCGRCVEACAMHLVPTKVATAAKMEDWDLAKQHFIQACLECGCCAFECPANIPLVQQIRTGKRKMPRD